MKFVILTFLTWKIVLSFVSILSLKLLPLRTGFLGGGIENYSRTPLLWGWANMDGQHYLSIAKNGYFQYEQAFFPLYPLLIRGLSVVTGDYLLSALLISHASFLLALFFLYKLVKMEYQESVARWTIFFLLVFPTSFFFGSVYSESLFLFLIVSSFYCAKKEKWWLAGIIGGLASATRLVGIFLFPALLWEWWKSKKIGKQPFSQSRPEQSRRVAIQPLASIAIIPLGLLSYMWYLIKTTGDPLFFFHAQPAFGAGRSGANLILLPQVIYRYLKIFLTAQLSYDYLIAILEFISFIFAVYLLLKSFKKISPSYQVFAWLTLITPTLTGSLSSMPRYLLSAFPLFIIIALENTRVKQIFLSLSILFLVLGTMFYFRGFFVS